MCPCNKQDHSKFLWAMGDGVLVVGFARISIFSLFFPSSLRQGSCVCLLFPSSTFLILNGTALVNLVCRQELWYPRPCAAHLLYIANQPFDLVCFVWFLIIKAAVAISSPVLYSGNFPAYSRCKPHRLVITLTNEYKR